MRAKYVNVYMVDQAYGGPEEGGWWYNTWAIEESHACPDREQAERLRTWLEAGDFNNQVQGNRELGSVLSRGVWELHVEDEPGSDGGEDPYYS